MEINEIHLDIDEGPGGVGGVSRYKILGFMYGHAINTYALTPPPPPPPGIVERLNAWTLGRLTPELNTYTHNTGEPAVLVEGDADRIVDADADASSNADVDADATSNANTDVSSNATADADADADSVPPVQEPEVRRSAVRFVWTPM